MANNRQGNQGQNPQQRQNGGMPGQGQAREALGAAQEGLEQAGNRLRQGFESAGESVEHGYRRAEGMVARNPTNSVMIGFGVGFGIGLALYALMTREESWVDRLERKLPDRVRDRIPSSVTSTAKHAPEAVQHVVDQVTESLRGLPDAIARMVPSFSRH